MTTPGTASTSDARKRNAEREQSGSFSPTGPTSPTSTYSTTTNADQPPALPDTSEALAEAIRVVVESRFTLNEDQSRAVREATKQIIAALTPPPAEPEPAWAAISEDPERPTLALVTSNGDPDGIVSRWWRDRGRLYNDESHYDTSWFHADYVTSVTILHTYNPETHVPVERALIEEAFDFIVEHGEGAPTDLERRLRAALADGGKS